MVILDNCSIHKSKKVKIFVAKTAWLELEHLAPYSPEYNQGVIVRFPDAYAANRLFCRTLDDSDKALGIGLAAKYF